MSGNGGEASVTGSEIHVSCAPDGRVSVECIGAALPISQAVGLLRLAEHMLIARATKPGGSRIEVPRVQLGQLK